MKIPAIELNAQRVASVLRSGQIAEVTCGSPASRLPFWSGKLYDRVCELMPGRVVEMTITSATFEFDVRA